MHVGVFAVLIYYMLARKLRWSKMAKRFLFLPERPKNKLSTKHKIICGSFLCWCRANGMEAVSNHYFAEINLGQAVLHT